MHGSGTHLDGRGKLLVEVVHEPREEIVVHVLRERVAVVTRHGCVQRLVERLLDLRARRDRSNSSSSSTVVEQSNVC